MKKKPLILVTNDDGITAAGIRSLVEVAREFGEVVVVAPDSPQSGQGHAITINDPLRLKKSSIFGPEVEAFECTGTPVDCVKLATRVILKGRKIDFCFSGINHGSNASINVIYSGTMSAAMEASLEHIPSIGFSFCDYANDADLSMPKIWSSKIIRQIIDIGYPKNCNLLNVNIPKAKTIHGVKVCRQAMGRWVEEFKEGKTPTGQPYWWLTGRFECEDRGDDTDIWAIEHGWVSVVPTFHDLTRHDAIQFFKFLEEK